jgi:two-component system, OmpR family, response regulator
VLPTCAYRCRLALSENVALTGTRRNVLIIEDDPETASQLADFLSARGYRVDLARNGDDGLRLASSRRYAVVTIDRMLPGVDGLSIVRKLRESGIDIPALIVSALGEVDDRVRGLRDGGDDYLVKPFAFAELLARIEALARRSTTVAKETVEIALLPREFQVLEYLVRNADQVVPRAMLLRHVWNLNFDPTTNIIDVYVGRVRRKVDNSHSYPLIHTVRGVGFCIRAHC